ncbi:MAG: hypothetical protein GWO24_08885, partial [Akkermansiaceae bacterium]|nr:hypothetical protein [Akkermansiaceae bacterium]
MFDLATGGLKHFVLDNKNGGHQVMAGKAHYYVSGGTYSMENGARLSNENPRLTDRDTLVFEEGGSIHGRVARGEENTNTYAITPKDGPHHLFLKAANRVYTAGNDRIAAYDITGANGERTPAWSAEIEGKVHHMLAGDEKLFVVTEEPRIYCFGDPEPGQATSRKHVLPVTGTSPPAPSGDRSPDLLANLMIGEDFQDGYALALGIASEALVSELINRSNLHLVVLDRAPEKIEALRRRYDKAGLYGIRLAAQVGDIASASLPPYLASLIVCEDPVTAGFEP